MLGQYFVGRSNALIYVKIGFLVLLVTNLIFSITILVMMVVQKNLVLPYLGVQVDMTDPHYLRHVHAQLRPLIEAMIAAIYKAGMEEMSQFIILEILGLFAVLFDGVALTLMFGTAYLMPSVRITLNLAFGKLSGQWICLIFMILKMVVALASFLYAYLVSQEHAAVGTKKKDKSVNASSLSASTSATSGINK